jgi:hypothetical protein
MGAELFGKKYLFGKCPDAISRVMAALVLKQEHVTHG